MEAIEAIVAAFAPKRIQKNNGQQSLSDAPVRSPYQIILSASSTFWHHGSSCPWRTIGLNLSALFQHTPMTGRNRENWMRHEIVFGRKLNNPRDKSKAGALDNEEGLPRSPGGALPHCL
jgi:hypothetical protein